MGGNISRHCSHSLHAPVTFKLRGTANEREKFGFSVHQPKRPQLPRRLVRNRTFHPCGRFSGLRGRGDGSALRCMRLVGMHMFMCLERPNHVHLTVCNSTWIPKKRCQVTPAGSPGDSGSHGCGPPHLSPRGSQILSPVDTSTHSPMGPRISLPVDAPCPLPRVMEDPTTHGHPHHPHLPPRLSHIQPPWTSSPAPHVTPSPAPVDALSRATHSLSPWHSPLPAWGARLSPQPRLLGVLPPRPWAEMQSSPSAPEEGLCVVGTWSGGLQVEGLCLLCLWGETKSMPAVLASAGPPEALLVALGG